MKLVVVNTGSTSIKLQALQVTGDSAGRLHSARHDDTDADPRELVRDFVSEAGAPDALVHRVVHGGKDLTASCIIDDAIEQRIEQLGELAPLHNPLALRWIRTCRQELEVPQVAVFDTAFFAALPVVAKSYAVPRDLPEKRDIRRYGFHGIAHQAMWRRWCELRPDLPAGGRLITMQLGGGCSITAIRNGEPQDTSMGFSPAEGLMMATRCGDIDAGAIVHLMRNQVMAPDIVEELINEQSGLLGLSGKSADMRELIDDSDPAAQEAVELYCYRLRKYIGAYLAVLGGADGIVFGGGVGEHIPQVRERALVNMEWCAIELEEEANRAASGEEARISASASAVDVRVIPTDETRILAGEAYALLAGETGADP
jgi:acetate kinase